MSLIRYALVAAAASMLAGAAVAQATSSGSTDNMPSASGPQTGTDQMNAPAEQNPPPAAADTSGPPTAQTAVGTETSAVVNGQSVQVVSSQPVPDTPENRAKYGQPLSRAGKRTKPIGN